MEKTMKTKEFTIPFSGLKLGRHHFDFQIDSSFFDAFEYNEFNSANVKINVVLDKMSTVMEFEMQAKGTVNVACDLTNEPYNQPIEGSLKLVVKFGEDFNDEDDEILVLPHGEHQVNIAQYVYEMIVLAVPSKRIHPGVKDGTLNSDVLEKLEELQPKAEKEEQTNTDPRWDALKSLKKEN
jgi:uncharacterized metal-binding protein YceD (DUF177 family)